MKVLIDTCVSLDFLQQREPFFENAVKVFEAIKEEKIEGYITIKSMMDIHYVTKHILHDENSVRRIIQNLIILLSPLDSTAHDAVLALNSDITDYEDALMAETAFSQGLDYIVTRNTKDYKHSAVPIITPEELAQIV